MRRRTAGITTILTIGACLLPTLGAAAKPADTIKYRHAVMEGMSAHVNAFMLIATNKIDGRQFLQNHGDAIADLSGELDSLFPADSAPSSGGSEEPETHALPAIWDESEKFAAAVTKMQEAAATLQETTRSGDNKAIMGAFAAAGKACKGCHEDFRAEEEDDHDHEH